MADGSGPRQYIGRKPRLSAADAQELVRLVKLRRTLTDAELAKRFGLSRTGVQFYARGLHKIGPATRAGWAATPCAGSATSRAVVMKTGRNSHHD